METNMKLYNLTITVADKKKGHAVTIFKATADNDLEVITKMMKRFTGKNILTFTINSVTNIPEGVEQTVMPVNPPKQHEDWPNKKMFVIHPDYVFPSKLDWDKVLNKPKPIKKSKKTVNKKQLTREQAERMLKLLLNLKGNKK